MTEADKSSVLKGLCKTGVIICSKVRLWEGNDNTKKYVIGSPKALLVTPQFQQSQEAIVTAK